MGADPEPRNIVAVHLAESAVTKSHPNGINAIMAVYHFEVKPRVVGITPK
jgi:hypothetical protein